MSMLLWQVLAVLYFGVILLLADGAVNKFKKHAAERKSKLFIILAFMFVILAMLLWPLVMLGHMLKRTNKD